MKAYVINIRRSIAAQFRYESAEARRKRLLKLALQMQNSPATARVRESSCPPDAEPSGCPARDQAAKLPE